MKNGEKIQPLKTVARFYDLNMAQVSAGLLEENGIKSFLPDEGLMALYPAMWSQRGCVRLQVLPEDEERAREILSQEVPDLDLAEDVEGEPEEPVPLTRPLWPQLRKFLSVIWPILAVIAVLFIFLFSH